MGRTSLVIGYGVCVSSWDKVQKYVLPHVGDRPLLGLSGQQKIAEAYNSILAAYRHQGLEALVLQHDDLQITDPYAETKFLAAVREPDVALVGVAGSRDYLSMHWWNGDTLGHQMTDSSLLDFGVREGEALFIEGSIMVFSPWAIENLRFDTRYPGFLGYDDICATAVLAGKRNLVVDVDTHHHSTVGIKSESVRRDWADTEVLFWEKWGVG
jgi:hypothetical protein